MSQASSHPGHNGFDSTARRKEFDELLSEFSDAYALYSGQIRLTVTHSNKISDVDLAKVWPGGGIQIEMLGAASLKGETCGFIISSHSNSNERNEARDNFKRLAARGGSRLRQHRMLTGGGLEGPVLQWVAYVQLQLAGDGAERIGSLTVYEPFDASIQTINGIRKKCDVTVRTTATVALSTTGSVTLFGWGDNPLVNGNEKKALSNARYDVVLALLRAGDKGLTKDELDRKSGRGDARKVLKRLAESDPDWESVISFPGTTGKGYRIL